LVLCYIIAHIKCHLSHAAADDCGRSVIHASSVSAANNVCLLCIGAASAHLGSDGLLGFANVKPTTAQKSSILPMVLGIQAWNGPRYALCKLSHTKKVFELVINVCTRAAHQLCCCLKKQGLTLSQLCFSGAIAFVPTTVQLQLAGLNTSQLTFLRMVQGRCSLWQHLLHTTRGVCDALSWPRILHVLYSAACGNLIGCQGMQIHVFCPPA